MVKQVCLVTGGAGFIGSHLVERLLKMNYHVRIIDNLSTGSINNVAHLIDKAALYQKDIRDITSVLELAEGADYIFHQAAIPSVPRSVKDPITTNDVGISGTLNVLEAARKIKPKRFIYASSSSVYGNSPALPKVETMPPNPLSGYAITKMTGEYYCKVYHNIYGLETVSLRYFNIFGPRQDPSSEYSAVIPRFISQLLEGTAPTIFGTGEQSRDFTYIDNAVEANILAMNAPGAAGKVINIACNQAVTLNELYASIADILKKNIEPQFAALRPGDVLHSLADISRARDLLGYEVKVPFKKGLKKTIEWFVNNRSTLKR